MPHVRATGFASAPASHPRRELPEIVNPQRFLDRGNVLDHSLKAVGPEELLFLLLKLLAQPVILAGVTRSWKAGKSTVSSRAACGSYMRRNQCRVSTNVLRSSAALERLRRGQPQHGVRQPPAGLVLLEQDRDQLDQLVRLLEARERETPLPAFRDSLPRRSGRLPHSRRGPSAAVSCIGVEPLAGLGVDQEDASQRAVLRASSPRPATRLLRACSRFLRIAHLRSAAWAAVGSIASISPPPVAVPANRNSRRVFIAIGTLLCR